MSVERTRRLMGLVAAVALFAATPSLAFAQKSADRDTYEEMYWRYLAAARRTPVSSLNWITDLMMDSRARRANDLLTIRVVERLDASGSSDARLDKGTKATAGIQPPSFSTEQNIVKAGVKTEFAGAGGTSRATEVTATMSARVVEVLPNGDLSLEGVREVDINGERQIVVLTGVVRQADIATSNVVLSTAVGQLRIQVVGKGLTRDSMTPGWLVRMLNKVF